MKTCKLQRQLNQIAERAQLLEEMVIAEARAKYVVPFCDRKDWSFCAGMGAWAFYDPHGEPIDHERIPVRVLAVLTAEVLNRSQDAGSLMADYTPSPLLARGRSRDNERYARK